MPLHIPRGLACQHHWTSGDSRAASLGVPSDTQRVKLDRITGWRSLGEAEALSVPATGRIGEVALPVSARGKDMTYEGRLQARTPQDLEALEYALGLGFGERSLLGIMRVVPQAALFGGGVVWVYAARVTQLDIDDEQEVGPHYARGPWERPFILGLRLFDPRFYSEALIQSASQASAAALTVVNEGNAPTDPVFTVAVPSGGADVTLTGRGHTLRFAGVPTGSFVVDFAKRTAKVGAADEMGRLDLANSGWWSEHVRGLVPGSQTVSVTVTGGTWSVAYRHASW